MVDNASSDGTSDLIRNHYPTVVLIESGANLGFAGGNNLGLAACHGRYICLINPDIVVPQKALAAMLHYMEARSEVGMLGPQIVGPDGVVQRSCMREPTLWNQFCRALALDTFAGHSRLFGGYLMADFTHQRVREVPIINGCFWMVRREALLEVGRLDSNFWMYGEDLDWCRRFRRAGWKVLFFPGAQVIHYGGGSSQNASLPCYLQLQRANLQYWRKYHGCISSWSYYCLLLLGHALRGSSLWLAYVVAKSRRVQLRPRIARHVAAFRRLAFEENPATLHAREVPHA